eukprot:TRINITY_DN11594_c0_g1_i1.p1 TRINITY_DN11594_c0_g1~~TRINITY_DN11594_c0_g1_i1.p1  ORF type:complete len:393 (+),score=83.72 TRINITY_DN11594_c0_g1_i1:156-1181(+)
MQHSLLLLDELLVQGGYAPEAAARVRRDFAALAGVHALDQVALGTLFTGGAERVLVKISGALRGEGVLGVNAHIPLDVWIPKEYPMHCPACYVRPPRGAAVAAGHPSIDMGGRCVVKGWRAEFGLLALANELQGLFAQRPPLVEAKPVAAMLSPGVGRARETSGAAVGIDMHNTAAHPLYRKLKARLVEQCRQKRDQARMAVDAWCRRGNRAAALTEGYVQQTAEAGADLNAAADAAAAMRAEITAARGYLATHRPVGAAADVTLHPVSAAAQQALELTAEVAALEDCLYVLDRRLARGAVPPSVFVRQVTALAAEIFEKKALLRKARCAADAADLPHIAL